VRLYELRSSGIECIVSFFLLAADKLRTLPAELELPPGFSFYIQDRLACLFSELTSENRNILILNHF
jgi:hypothetical protein